MIAIYLLDYLQIKTEEQNADKVILTMKIEDFHKQPYGILHGGINGVLIETACSLGANEQLDLNQCYAVGVDLQVNHLKSVVSGELTVVATPDHIGGTIQVWQANIYNEQEQLISVGRCTLMNRAIRKES